MNFNITSTMNNSHFENKENLRQAAKNILNKNGATTEATNKILEQTIFSNTNRINTQLEILSLASQASLNESLKETLKYLKSQNKYKKNKQPIFGELWDKTEKDEKEYDGELLDFVIDSSVKNIFEAA